MRLQLLAAAITALVLLASCAWYPLARLPSDKEGALVVRCREVKGWFGRDSHWVMIVWVWSKTGALPEAPGSLEIDSECRWSVEREPGPQITLRPLPPAQPTRRASNLTRSRRRSSVRCS